MNYVLFEKNCTNGYNIENQVMNLFRDWFKEYPNLEIRKIDNYYDFEIVYNNIVLKKIEIKSCQYYIFNGSEKYRKYGMFNFTNKKNITMQRSNNVIICFCLCIGSNFEILGFINSKSLKQIKSKISHQNILKRNLQNPYIFRDKIIKKIENES